MNFSLMAKETAKSEEKTIVDEGNDISRCPSTSTKENNKINDEEQKDETGAQNVEKQYQSVQETIIE